MFLRTIIAFTFLSAQLIITSVSGGRYCSVHRGVKKGQINDRYIHEASGLAYTRRPGHSGIFWTHNDSPDHGEAGNWINAISVNGQRRAGVELQGIRNKDWEDIAVNQENGKSFIYIGDIGNNGNWRSTLTIYKFEEPYVSPYKWNGNKHIRKITRIHIKYPHNKRYDCEAMVVDPRNKDILLFTKDTNNYRSHVYKVPHNNANVKTLEKITTLPYKKVTGADISPSGNTLALTSYGEGWSWHKPSQLSWANFLKSNPTPCKLNLKQENQREAIAITNSGFWTTSEHRNQPLWYYRRN